MKCFRLAFLGYLERNRRTLEDVSSFDSQLLDCFALTLFYWSRAWGFTTGSTVIDFISSLYLLHDDVIIWYSTFHVLCTLWSNSFNNIFTFTYQKTKLSGMKKLVLETTNHCMKCKQFYDSLSWCARWTAGLSFPSTLFAFVVTIVSSLLLLNFNLDKGQRAYWFFG